MYSPVCFRNFLLTNLFKISLFYNKKRVNKKINYKDKEKILRFLSYRGFSYEIIKNRSKETNFFIEFDKMWIHGLLHLLGYNHVKFKDYKQMLRKEQDILKRVN